MTIRESLSAATVQLLQRADLAEWAARDASLLLQHVLGVERSYLLAHPERVLSSQELEAFHALIARRLHAEPIQHLTQQQEFYGRVFRVSRDVLIPRPETEMLIDLAKESFAPDATIRVADIGTGSGALAVTLAHEFRHAQIVAADLSPAALAVAQQNADAHGVMDRVAFVASDLFSAIEGEFDLVLSNPPYIAEQDAPTLHAQVREYEPAMALFAGTDGNEIYRRLIPQAWSHLRSGGVLLMEQGQQGDALLPFLHEWNDVVIHKDLQQIPRAVFARKP